jgi:hypothetical protein
MLQLVEFAHKMQPTTNAAVVTQPTQPKTPVSPSASITTTDTTTSQFPVRARFIAHEVTPPTQGQARTQ